MNISQIYEGWRNKLVPPAELKEQIGKVAEERIAICEGCEWHSKNHESVRPDAHCTHCGCTLSAKTKCLSCSCPINKWAAVLTAQQEDEVKKNGGEQREQSSN